MIGVPCAPPCPAPSLRPLAAQPSYSQYLHLKATRPELPNTHMNDMIFNGARVCTDQAWYELDLEQKAGQLDRVDRVEMERGETVSGGGG